MSGRRRSAVPGRVLVAVLAVLAAAPGEPARGPVEEFTLAQVLSAPYPDLLVAARAADRIAWVTYDEGNWNVWTASGSDFAPRELTEYRAGDGEEIPELRISDDGEVVVFVRGGRENREGEHPNPLSLPRPREQRILALNTGGGEPWELARGGAPVLSPAGEDVVFVRDGQLWHVPVQPRWEAADWGNGAEQLFEVRGRVRDPVWSPDGSRIAFVSERDDHSFVGVYEREAGSISWMDPAVDRDRSPTFSPDGSRVAFFRTPGRAFRGSGTFHGGHRVTIRLADVATGDGYEIWNPPADVEWHVDTGWLRWVAEDRILFRAEAPEWSHVYGLSNQGGEAFDLTPGEGIAEHVDVSADGRFLYFDSNRADLDRRHLWRVPTAGGEPVQLTSGGVLDTRPAVMGEGALLAFLSADATRPQSVAVLPARGGEPRVVAHEPPWDFPSADLVVPELVTFVSGDGLQIHGQLFLPVGAAAGDGRPGVVFLHGGPRRQMLPGWHYKRYYTNTYGFHQYLANRGFVVLSVNFRGGIGYGRSFRTAEGTGRRGASEYQDVVAGGRYLQERPEVDPERIGIWGGSWGGYLAAMGLARDSDLFRAGVDLNGVHAWSPDEPDSLAFRSSPMAFVDGWRSPVFLSHGDDDRNVPFSQTVGLVQALRERGVEYELQVFPDEVHEYLIHRRLLDFYRRAAGFLERHLAPGTGTGEGNDAGG